MKGRSGHVTIRFEQAIHIHSIVLDHLSPALARNRGNKYISSSSAIRSFHVVGYGSCENKAFNSSLSKAEKSMCAILGFDISNRFELGHFEYSRPVLLNERQKGRINNDHDIDGSSLHEAEKAYPGTYQLFATPRKYSESIMTNAKQETEAETYDFIEESLDYANDDNSEQERGGSCTLSSCSASPSQEQAQHEQDIAVKAITVAIGDNWGNDDYTCIYRLGVYGESAP